MDPWVSVACCRGSMSKPRNFKMHCKTVALNKGAVAICCFCLLWITFSWVPFWYSLSTVVESYLDIMCTGVCQSCKPVVAIFNDVLMWNCFFCHYCHEISASVLRHCWLGGRKGIQPVKNWAVGCWHGYLSRARCRLAYGLVDSIATHCLLLQ